MKARRTTVSRLNDCDIIFLGAREPGRLGRRNAAGGTVAFVPLSKPGSQHKWGRGMLIESHRTMAQFPYRRPVSGYSIAGFCHQLTWHLGIALRISSTWWAVNSKPPIKSCFSLGGG